jgi:NAD(P)H-dependent FMN reductase
VVRVKILLICGSLQARSSNLSLLEGLVVRAPVGVEVVLFDGLRHLPLFDPDLEAASGPLPVVERWRQAIGSSDGVLIASPEYGHSLPGALKNAIDWVIGTGELERKAVAITAAVPGPERGRRGLKALQDTLGAVSARVVGGEPIPRGPQAETQADLLLLALVEEARRPLE